MKKKTSKLLILLASMALMVGCGSSEPASSEVPSSVAPSTSVITSSSEIPSSEVPSSSSQTPSSSEVIPGKDLALGTESDAVRLPGNFFYSRNAETVTVVKAREVDDVITLQYTAAVSAAYDHLKLFFEHPDNVTGWRYQVTFVLNAGLAFTGLVNGQRISFARGNNDVSVYNDEAPGASLVVIFAAEDTALIANTVSISGLTFERKVYDAPTALVADGDYSDWLNTRAFVENPLSLVGVNPDTEHKSVHFYAALVPTGLYVLAITYHDVYINDANDWWMNTNFEWFVNTRQYYISANPARQSTRVTARAMVTTAYEDGVANYKTITEGFVPTAQFPANAVIAGQIRVGFAWKTPGDRITGGEAAGGGYDEYWVPAGTWVNNADQTYVTVNGIFRRDQVNIQPTLLTIDGNLSDWASYAAYTTNKVTVVGTLDSSHKSVSFYAMLTDEGLYMAALARHDVFINDQATWHMNTNFEVFVGSTQYYITAANQKSAGTGIISNSLYSGTAVYESVAELFIPTPYLPTGLTVRVGFAWKTNGDTMTGAGGSGGAADAWWFAPGHTPNNTAQQYYVNANGIFETSPV